MPWQAHLADIAGEVDSNGRLCYSRVLFSVPRQSGKTTVVLPVIVGRAEAGEPFGGKQTMLMAAQRRVAARKKWHDDYVYNVTRAKVMQGRTKVLRGAGSERLTFFSSDSTLEPIATQEDSGHGEVLDFAALDEAFAQKDDRVPASWRPAMSTRPMAQLWMYSTMGDATAVWWHDQVDKAREAVLEDRGYGTCYVEYSTPDDVTDYGNPDVWARCMPALGRTQRLEFVQDEFREMPLHVFRRSYLNQRVDGSGEQVLNAEKWAQMFRAPDDAVRATRPVLTFDVAYDRSAATVAIGYELEDGTPAVRVAAHGRGTSWVTDTVMRLREELDVTWVVADKRGPANSVIDELKNEYVEVYTTNEVEMTTACSAIYDGVENVSFVHYGEPPLNKAVTGAGRRELGDAWAWTRKRSELESGTDISPLVAITLAHWAQAGMGEHADHDWTGSFG